MNSGRVFICGLAGAVFCGLLSVLMFGVSSVIFNDRNTSYFTEGLAYGLIIALPIGAVMGFAVGWIIGKRDFGYLLGVATGFGVFIAGLIFVYMFYKSLKSSDPLQTFFMLFSSFTFVPSLLTGLFVPFIKNLFFAKNI